MPEGRRIDRIAYIDEKPCAFDVSIEALAFHKRKRPCFFRPRFLADRKDTRRLRFSFFLQRCQTAGRSNPPVRYSGQEAMPVPFRAVPASPSQSHLEYMQGCWRRRAARVPQWGALYVGGPGGVKRLREKVFNNPGRPLKQARNRQLPLSGQPLKEGFASVDRCGSGNGNT